MKNADLDGVIGGLRPAKRSETQEKTRSLRPTTFGD